ncbi:MAG: membrane protein insertion efficiency factor YidD [FCB group bacterium]|nr:membrane protein insertion efficiency factor YidD [FCB group bacterium]MBL7027283.1 membrane protein insertion efficiency factor YidD [Candidatus Neomarinimicrobiota bacterium]MBL7122253.1 membrane protein insertion efficiency factor YidD [Candidatus Neomarinimicrobiota bacterium]
MNKWINMPFVLLVRFYQLAISPLFPDSCRFYPTCSHYTVEAFEKLPLWKALPKSTWRILRCNPYTKGGFDPVIKE